MLNKLIKIANTLDKKGFYIEANIIDKVIVKLADIQDEGGLNEPYNAQPSPIVDQINESDNNLLIYNKVANDLAAFFKSVSENEFENISMDRFVNYRRIPEDQLKEENPKIVQVIEKTNDILDDILLKSLEEDQVIANIARNNGIQDDIIVDAIYHMIGSHNPLNANQVQAALYEVTK